ncbi:MAG TPA: hypothetical protein VH597_03990 [Verrucomicrobiae bacterium]|jgi:hypothetical protein|nr:hypothetical protein [Verrucomicrobiae bacterium]
MKKPLEGSLSDHGKGLGTVTREMVMVRARQIAMLNGRTEKSVLDSDFSEAKRELLGEDEINPEPTAEEKLPEDERWDPVPGSEGHKVPATPPDDEQSVAEKLYDEGIADAEHDESVEATREDLRRDKE